MNASAPSSHHHPARFTLLRRSNRRRCCSAARGVWLCLLASSGVASAGERGEGPAKPPTIEVGARAFLAADPGYGTLGVGFEAVRRSGGRFGLGMAARGFMVSDSEYGEERGSGWHVLALGEVDVFPGWITPYARLAVGGGRRISGYLEEYDDPVFAADLEGGITLRDGHFVLRGFIGPSLNGSAILFPVGLQLGGAFDAP